MKVRDLIKQLELLEPLIEIHIGYEQEINRHFSRKRTTKAFYLNEEENYVELLAEMTQH